jgi:hypothetical protein
MRVTARGSGEDGRRQAARWRAGGGALFLKTDFEIFTKIPLTPFCKLLPNFLKKLKKLQKQNLLNFSNPTTF